MLYMQRSIFNLFLSLALFITNCAGPSFVSAQELVMPLMPKPGTMVALSDAFEPAYLQGMTVHADNPLQFDFIMNKGQDNLSNADKRAEYDKLIKYFLASLTIADKDQWVNLSPYEKGRIIENGFGKTEMGRDLLAQDYLLKQITSSLMYPELGLGKKFWDKVYERAGKEFGTANIPVNTFNKVWIMPDDVMVYESGQSAVILKSHLKVMLEEDYLATTNNQMQTRGHISERNVSPNLLPSVLGLNVSATQGDRQIQNIIKQIILPELEKEVNEGKNFASLRQIVSAMIIASWYKKALKESLLGKVYVDKARVKGVDSDPKDNEIIYQKYLEAFKKGAFNLIKEDEDRFTHQLIPRKYFAGGFSKDFAMQTLNRSNILQAVGLEEAKVRIARVRTLGSIWDRIVVWNANRRIAHSNDLLSAISGTTIQNGNELVAVEVVQDGNLKTNPMFFHRMNRGIGDTKHNLEYQKYSAQIGVPFYSVKVDKKEWNVFLKMVDNKFRRKDVVISVGGVEDHYLPNIYSIFSLTADNQLLNQRLLDLGKIFRREGYFTNDRNDRKGEYRLAIDKDPIELLNRLNQIKREYPNYEIAASAYIQKLFALFSVPLTFRDTLYNVIVVPQAEGKFNIYFFPQTASLSNQAMVSKVQSQQIGPNEIKFTGLGEAGHVLTIYGLKEQISIFRDNGYFLFYQGETLLQINRKKYSEVKSLWNILVGRFSELFNTQFRLKSDFSYAGLLSNLEIVTKITLDKQRLLTQLFSDIGYLLEIKNDQGVVISRVALIPNEDKKSLRVITFQGPQVYLSMQVQEKEFQNTQPADLDAQGMRRPKVSVVPSGLISPDQERTFDMRSARIFTNQLITALKDTKAKVITGVVDQRGNIFYVNEQALENKMTAVNLGASLRIQALLESYFSTSHVLAKSYASYVANKGLINIEDGVKAGIENQLKWDIMKNFRDDIDLGKLKPFRVTVMDNGGLKIDRIGDKQLFLRVPDARTINHTYTDQIFSLAEVMLNTKDAVLVSREPIKVLANAPGGIDLNAAHFDMRIKRDGNGVVLPMPLQDMKLLGDIEGFVPDILEIRPAINVPILSELEEQLKLAGKTPDPV